MVHIQWLLLYKQNTKPNKHNTKQLLSNTKKLLFILMPTYWQLYANTIYIAYFPIIIYQVSLLTLFRISEKPHKDYFMPIVYMLLTTQNLFTTSPCVVNRTRYFTVFLAYYIT